MKLHALRLKPGQDLRKEIQKFADNNNIQGGFVITCVGGLQKAILRMPGATPKNQTIETYTKKLEIVSLVGTISTNGSHLHISVSDNKGKVFGGHLKDGSIVANTAEIVVGEGLNATYLRKLDKETDFYELAIKARER